MPLMMCDARRLARPRGVLGPKTKRTRPFDTGDLLHRGASRSGKSDGEGDGIPRSQWKKEKVYVTRYVKAA